jgi:hypothetical protein
MQRDTLFTSLRLITNYCWDSLSFPQLRNPLLNHNCNFASALLNGLCDRLRLGVCRSGIRLALHNLDLRLQLLVPFCAELETRKVTEATFVVLRAVAQYCVFGA